ncbi:hypothetical protein DUNSADRAFT_3975 [Dunaliella salina]|uniref:Protein kinase domain-containing protein n=1 Tax=Dunaliella salina TaxID=3046 RepID=A0ABQ7GT16_DUNSA|nr:hypothetical protein DUNSADRAFT_3975 [Dunaliella salina]|eukprot:KAF5837720.1 hypothetical protein DUNSADRAFT_3975 [Dunaliella salina]
MWSGGSGQLLRPEATVCELHEAGVDTLPFQLSSTQVTGATGGVGGGGGALTRHGSLASSAAGGCVYATQHAIHPRQTQLSCHDSLTSHRPTRHDSLASGGAASGILAHGRQFSGIDHSSRQGSGIMSQLQHSCHNDHSGRQGSGIDHSSRQGSGVMSQLQQSSHNTHSSNANHNSMGAFGSIRSSDGHMSGDPGHDAAQHSGTSVHASSSLLAALFCGGGSGSPTRGQPHAAQSPVLRSKGGDTDAGRGCAAGPDWRHTIAGLLGGCGLGGRRAGPSHMLSDGGGSGELSGQRGPYLTSSAALESAPSSPAPAIGGLSKTPSSGGAALASRGRGRSGRGRPGGCSRKKGRQHQAGAANLHHGQNSTCSSNSSNKGGGVASRGLSSSRASFGAGAPAAGGAGAGSVKPRRGEDSNAGATAFLYQFTKEDEDWLVRAPQLSVWDEKYPTMPAAVGDDGLDGSGDTSSFGMWGMAGEQQPAVMGPVCYLPTADQTSFLPRRMTSGMLDSTEVEGQLLLEENLLPPVLDPAISPGLPRITDAPTSGQGDRPQQPQQANGQVAGVDATALAVSRQGSLLQMAMPNGSYPHTTTDDDDVRSRIIRRKCMTWAGRPGIDGDDQAPSLVDLPHGVVANLMPPPRRYLLVPHASGSPSNPPGIPPSPSSPVLLPTGGSCASQLAARHCYYYQRTPRQVPPVDLHIDFEKEVAPTLGRLIGVGGFGRVYAAQWRGQDVAVKVLLCDDAKHYQALLKEVQLCARFRACPFIVRLLGACMGPRCKRTQSKASMATAAAGAAAALPAGLHSVRKSSTAHNTYSSTNSGTGIVLEAGTDVKPGGGADKLTHAAQRQPPVGADHKEVAGCDSPRDELPHSGAPPAGDPHPGTAHAGSAGILPAGISPLSPKLASSRLPLAAGADVAPPEDAALHPQGGHEASPLTPPAACQPHKRHHHHHRRRHRHYLPPPALHRLQRRQKHRKAQEQQQQTGLQGCGQEPRPSQESPPLQRMPHLSQPFLLNDSMPPSTCSTPDAMAQAPPAFLDPPCLPRRSCSFAALQELDGLSTPLDPTQFIQTPPALALELERRSAGTEEEEHSACSSRMFQSAAGSSVFGSCSNTRDLCSWQGTFCFESRHGNQEQGRRKSMGGVLHQASSRSPSQLPTTPLSSRIPAVSLGSPYMRSNLERSSGSGGHSSYQSWDSSPPSQRSSAPSATACMAGSGSSDPHFPGAGVHHGGLHQHQSGTLAAAAPADASPLQPEPHTSEPRSLQQEPTPPNPAQKGHALLSRGPIGEGVTVLEAQGADLAKAAIAPAAPQPSAGTEGMVAAAQHNVRSPVDCNKGVQQQQCRHGDEHVQSAVLGRQGPSAFAGVPALQPTDIQACGCASSDAEWEKQREEEEMDCVDEEVDLQQREGPRQVSLIMELAVYSLAERIHVCKTQAQSAQERPEGGPMSMRELLQVSYDVAAGLAALHASGVIHRDLKPQNVLLVKERGKLCDFGISRLKDPYRSCVSVTQQGGTPHYMAPELFNGSRVDEKCDIYSLGCIIYECVTGKAPWSELNAPPPKPPRPCAEISSSSSSSSGGKGGSNEGPQQKPKHEAHGRGANSNSSGSSSSNNGAVGRSDGGAEGAAGGGGAVMPQGGMGALFQIILNVAINRRRPTIPDHCPPGVRALITACWRDDPRQRPPARVLMARLEELQRREAERRAIAAAAAKAKRTTSANSGNSNRRRRI